MTCKHLRDLEQALLDAGIAETCRGAVWTTNCREWVYFDCILDLASLRDKFCLPEIVKDRDLLGTHEGCERGFYCSQCHDGVMGCHPTHGPRRVFSGDRETKK